MRRVAGRACRWLLLAVVASGCGKGEYVLSKDSYEPRIVVQGFLQPGEPVERIWVWRNFRADANLRHLDLVPDDTRVTLTDEDSGLEYLLTWHPGERLRDNYFEYTGDGLSIEHGGSYTLDVTATIEGQALHTWSTTTVPQPGFEIVGVNHRQLPYRPLDEAGKPVNFAVTIERNPDVRLYLATIRPVEGVADSSNFVYDNPFTDEKPADVQRELTDWDYSYDWIQNVPREPGQSIIELFWYEFWFYGQHEITVYAADANYEDFLQTFDDVQEEDGNFHEPSRQMEGDGLGVFGSVVVDRIRVEVLRD